MTIAEKFDRIERGVHSAQEARDVKAWAWEVSAMLGFLRAHDGECLGDHPDWITRIDNLLKQ